MKFDALRAIGHNVADSLGSGIGLLIGVYETDIFEEASGTQLGVITVDFLAGKVISGVVSPSLADAIAKYQTALSDLCAKHGGSSSVFRGLTASYSADKFGRRIVVSVEDQQGR